MNLPLKTLAVALLAVSAPGLASTAGAQDRTFGTNSAPQVVAWHGGRSWWGPGAIVGGIVGGALAAADPYNYDYGYEYAPGYAYDQAPGYSAYGYAPPGAYAAAPGGPDVAYCEAHFRSYDPATGTYLGYDGIRHSCP
jgi:hypothetical protein